MKIGFLLAAVCISAAAAARSNGESAAPVYTNSWAVQVEGGEKEADALAAKYGFVNNGQIGVLKGMYEFVLPEHRRESRSTTPYRQMTELLRKENTVRFAEQQTVRIMQKKGYQVPTDPDWENQWFLLNSETGVLQEYGDSTRDLNVEPAWIQGVTGCNIVVGVVDDGVDFTHPDLSRNYRLELDYNAINETEEAYPGYSFGEMMDSHGTSCAGIIAMEKSNSYCGVGVAYNSNITGILLVNLNQTDIAEARALSHRSDVIDVYSNSWGPPDNGYSVGKLGPLAELTFKQEAKEGRNGKGSIYVWAAGNGGGIGDTCAADGYIQNIYTIAIGSVGSDGMPAYYDERCSAKIASTFVSNPFFNISVATTTTDGECVLDFDGTSAATPVASGTIALTLEANPDLTWRDVQYLIVYTSNPDILTVDDLATNGAGLKFSHHFGFGAVDAEAMVTRARHWINVPQQHNFTVPFSGVRTVMQDSNEAIVVSYSGSDVGFLEHVVVQVSTSFDGVDIYSYLDNNVYYNLYYDIFYYYDNVEPNRGDIQIELTSPQGTTSILLPYRTVDTWPGVYYKWPFMSVHFWAEDPSGDWTIVVRNRGVSGTLEVSDVKFTFYGTAETPEVVARIPQECDLACARGCAAEGAKFCDSCRELRDTATLACVQECAAGLASRNGYCYNATEPEAECEPPPTVETETTTEAGALRQSSRLDIASLVLTLVLLVSIF